MEKRGVSIFVFTIMFTLIAGAVILMFFFTFGKDLLDFGETTTKLTNAIVLEKNLASFALAPNADKEISFSEPSKINIECTSDGIKILPGKEKELLTQKLIFSPFEIEGDLVNAWSLAWNYPFKIDNLYLLADEDTKFYFKEVDTDEEKFFVRRFPKRFNILDRDPSTSEKAVIVSFSNLPIVTGNNKAVKIDLENAEVTFGGSSEELPLWGDAMIYAAIFTADKEKFDCLVNKGLAKKRLETMVEIYSKTRDSMVVPGVCDYTGFTDRYFNDLKSRGNIEAAIKIKDQNDLLKTSDCSTLFENPQTEILI